MRTASFICIFLTISAFAFAQNSDTNFSTGPQYLVNSSSPDLLHSIATPSLSLSAPLAAAPTASPEEGSGEPHTAAFPDLQRQSQIDRIYWGVSDIPNDQATEIPVQDTASGAGKSSVIELSSSALIPSLPAHFLDTGVTSMLDSDSLREHGYGIPLGDVAATIKANKHPAARVYTNADISRLHGG
jgi:hypothetical protein